MAKTKTILIGGAGLTTLSLIFLFLITNFNFQISNPRDIYCAGTTKEPCISEFTVYNPGDYNIKLQGTGKLVSFSPAIKSYKIYFNGRLTNLSSPNASVTFGSKKNVTVKIVGYKYNPKDTIKWSFDSGKGILDPYWLGTNYTTPTGYAINNQTLMLWNKDNNYYFNLTSGIQFTNDYENYWNKNVFCLGYYNGTTWIIIKCADQINFNQTLQTDNLTYANATFWTDFTYSGYDLRFGVRYSLKTNDENLSVMIYLKNMDTSDIPYDIGFAWKTQNVNIPYKTGSKITINNTNYKTDGNYNLVFTNMTEKRTIVIYNNITNTSYNQTVYTPMPTFRIFDYTKFLKLDWNQNLNYTVNIFANGNTSNFYSIILINAGTFASGQEKSTIIQWEDAEGDYTGITWDITDRGTNGIYGSAIVNKTGQQMFHGCSYTKVHWAYYMNGSFNTTFETLQGGQCLGLAYYDNWIWTISTTTLFKYNATNNSYIGVSYPINGGGEVSYGQGVAADENYIYIASEDKFVVIYNSTSGSYAGKWSTGISAAGIAIWGDYAYLGADGKKIIQKFYKNNGTWVANYTRTDNNNNGVAIAINGSYIFYGDYADKLVYLYVGPGEPVPSTDTEYPIFSNYQSNNNTLIKSGIGLFNVTVINTNGSVYLNINGSMIQASNSTATLFNASYDFQSGLVYSYNWSSYGNGTSHLFNASNQLSYTVFNDASICGILSLENTNYNLTRHVESSGTCFTISANNITLDCNGYSINYSNVNIGYGINLNYQNFTIIKNCIINESIPAGNTKMGIYFLRANNVTVFNNTINTVGQTSYAIYLDAGSNNLITNNTLITTGSLAGGIRLDSDSINNIISNNIINTTDGHSIWLMSNSNKSQILSNKILTSLNDRMGIYLRTSQSNLIMNNTITTLGNDSSGIYFEIESSSNLVINNTISTYGIRANGLFFATSENNNTFSGMRITTVNTNSSAITIYDSSINFTIKDSTLNSSMAKELFINTMVTGGEWNFTNVTKSDYSTITINWTIGGNGTLNRLWYLKVNVTNISSYPLANANMTLFDVSNSFLFSELTGADGLTSQQTIKEMMQNSSTTQYYFTPHIANISLTDYTTNSTSVNLTSSLNTFQHIILEYSLCVCKGPATNWIINCADNCTLNSNCDMNRHNISIYGPGQFTINANISNLDTIYWGNSCTIIQGSGTYFK